MAVEPGIEALLGEAFATALWRSSTATAGTTEHYAEAAADPLGMVSQHRVIEAHYGAGRLLLSWLDQGVAENTGTHLSGGVEFDDSVPESYARLGSLVINALTNTDRRDAAD
ncbi:hypothetical protein [Streptomonospora litoralis]|uniref:Uncharacterized protein n=1 Tax=Streptomonospora litoralis TaxID=2498135 RepID=A0A4P6PXY7_9ACTN|nr:hypothetical protein [Streptomonospora litoralis]QBI53078.1 hypothetical protein EKD16_06400 [Streptomonospora litoralis]